MTEEEALLENGDEASWNHEVQMLRQRKQRSRTVAAIILARTLFAFFLFWLVFQYILPSTPKTLTEKARVELKSHVLFEEGVPKISRKEFLGRQKKLATVLSKAGVDAFIAEPSPSTAYYTNVSSDFDLSERPFLIIITATGEFAYLAPKFELGRIATLQMVSDKTKVIEWQEEESPFGVLKKEMGFKSVMLDEHARFFIASGLKKTGMEVVDMSREVQGLRAVKSHDEVMILRAVNEFTLHVVQALAKHISVGDTAADIMQAARTLFNLGGTEVGDGVWAIILFGEEAANPHGGANGRKLREGEFVLIDIGTSLWGYGSDVTRTFVPQGSKVSEELLGVWWTVYAAQTAAIMLMRNNKTCSVVDGASRKVIANSGFGEFYTHRLGHGLGLEMHEHPYLNGANPEKLEGIYVTAKQARTLKLKIEEGFGIRLEDPILVTEEGPLLMTGARAQGPYQP
ncbi:peptidase M24, structural domain-containing protein [Calycina marina]|uniref:Probable Xaa-Pro aminopeptidase P n=1 Tax=Calycina marina TaxID=1763456 RepID=A0A9P8CEB3_9HELO|nr:peptidase M24, structural domain-containing protein [Calycina marina]